MIIRDIVSNTAALESCVMYLHAQQAALCKQRNNMTTTIIYRPCYAADDLILCLEDKQKVALSQHVLIS